jgi:hypothetical protein
MSKLYCYIDESGQDTKGSTFVVSIVIAQAERDELIATLERIEQESGKGDLKWAKAQDSRRVAYIRAVLKIPSFRGKLYYGTYANTLAYVELTVQTAAKAITAHIKAEKYKADVYLDGLRESERDTFAVSLRKQGIRTGKVRGLDDERDALIRLADAMCGFVRDTLEGRSDFHQLMEAATREGYLMHVGE